MSDKNQSSQLDTINEMMDDIVNLYKYCISLEERIGIIEVDTQHNNEVFDKLEKKTTRLDLSFDVHKQVLDTMSDNVFSMYKRIVALESHYTRIDEKNDSMNADMDYLYSLTHGCDNFCGNCEHCVSCPDGLYRCDLTNLELDPDSASCIRFKCPQIPKSDAEICKACSDKNTSRCYKCSHFPF